MTTIHVTLKALSPIAHGAFGPSTGNALLFRRLPIVSLPGRPRVPAVSGNSLRGVIRRLVMRELLERAGVTKETPGWDHLYAALANGGHLQGSEASIDPRMIAELRTNLPPLSIFGAALRTWMLEGRMDVGICWPRCMETFAAGLTAEGELPAEELVDELSHVRHVDRNEQDPDTTRVTPMPTTMEVLSTGSVLESTIISRGPATPIELGVVARGLDLLSTIGAKSSAGLGRVLVEHDGDATPYGEWLGSVTATTLEALAERLAGAGGKKRAKRAPAATTAG